MLSISMEDLEVNVEKVNNIMFQIMLQVVEIKKCSR